jgi:hypothetical protein
VGEWSPRVLGLSWRLLTPHDWLPFLLERLHSGHGVLLSFEVMELLRSGDHSSWGTIRAVQGLATMLCNSWLGVHLAGVKGYVRGREDVGRYTRRRGRGLKSEADHEANDRQRHYYMPDICFEHPQTRVPAPPIQIRPTPGEEFSGERRRIL